MNQSFKRLFNNKFVRNFSSYSISKEQILAAEDKYNRKGGLFKKVILFSIVSKLGYDATNCGMAYYKGEQATTESIVDQSWNTILYPVFQVITDSTQVRDIIGNNITISAPPPQSKSPIIELKRDFNVKLLPVDLSAASFNHDSHWFLQKAGISNGAPKAIDINKMTDEEIKKFEHALYQELYNHKLSDQIQMIPSKFLPLRVPYKNKLLPVVYGEATSDIIIPIQGSKGKANILFNLYASDLEWQVRNVEVIYDNNNIKPKSFIVPSGEL